MSVVVLCPTRGRPTAALEVLDTFFDTKADEFTEIQFVVDSDDPELPEYQRLTAGRVMVAPVPSNMVKALNWAALEILAGPDCPEILGFIGDDHRFRSDGWDTIVNAALAEPGIAYGDDLYQRQNLPTQVFISAKIVHALGWMALPVCRHLYVDDAWARLGAAIDNLIYMPEVVIEHMHPLAGKGEWDEGYRRVNDQSMYNADWIVFEAWVQNDLLADAERVKAALA